MKVERFTVSACCGKTATIFKTDRPLSKEVMDFFINQGFSELPQFTQAGILYVDNSDFFISGPFGSDRLQVKCKQEAECDLKLNNLEGLLLQLE